MWIGATRGLAGLKFSTSPKMLGVLEVIKIIAIIITMAGIVSFTENKGLNFTLSRFVWIFEGLEEPFSCNKIKWNSTNTVITIGKRKCKEKNRFKVGWDTEGPPQIHVTKSFPTIGMADKTPVITVAPQKDICPQGRTYPRNAVAIMASKRITPEIQTFGLLAGEEKYIPRAVWMYSRIKNKDAPFMWIIRVTHPVLISRIIITITLKAVSVCAVYIIDKINPLTIWSIKVIPRRKPKFHIKEIEEGVGKSKSAFFVILRIGFRFNSWFFIRRMLRLFDLGDDHELIMQSL